MAIHEKSLVAPGDLLTKDKLVVDGVDVSGHWNTMMKPRYVSDYDPDFFKVIQSYPGGENVHRCWQCGSCTNSCTVNALNSDFNPRHWIYLIRMGFEDELVRDKDLIWQCVSCNKCTYACPRDVVPEGVMKATAHWLELKVHTPKSPSTEFDEEFSSQVFRTGKIEDGRVMMNFFRRTGQPLMQPWLVAFVRKMIAGLPIGWLMKMGWATVFHPRTKNWGPARAAIEEYAKEMELKHLAAVKGGRPEARFDSAK
jgi:heterodisulfide reductase subunit C